MGQNEKLRWLVAYDICCPKRWKPIFKLLKNEGIPIQYSVFLVEASHMQMNALMKKIEKIIKKEDDVRAYHLGKNENLITLGSPLISDEIWIK